MNKFLCSLLFILIPLGISAQPDFKIAFTYSHPDLVKSPGLLLGGGYKNNNLQLSLSFYYDAIAPNQTVNSLTFAPEGVYNFGFAYLRSIEIKEVSVGLGAGVIYINGPRYYSIDYYGAGGYHIYRVEKDLIPSFTINADVAYKIIYLFSSYNLEMHNARFGIGLRL